MSTHTSKETQDLSTREGGLSFIEQLHANASLLCPNEKVPYLTGYKGNDVIMTRGSCGSWSCEVCGARNGKRWLARLLNHINSQDVYGWYFITLTAHEKWRGANASVINLRQGWKKLYNRMRRKYGRTDYVKVYEFHKDGSFHLHVLYARKIGKRWLKRNSRECGMGYIVDSSRSKNGGQVAGYVSKYLLKSFEFAHKYPKGMRRIECSRSWTKLPELDSGWDWTIQWSRDFQDKHVEATKGKRRVIDARPTRMQVHNAMTKN